MTSFAQDSRFALRLLRRTPGFAFTVVVTLGIGLGLNTTLFTLFNAYVLRPLAVRNPYSLYQLSASTRRNGMMWNYSWEQYQAIRYGSPVFSETLATHAFYARVVDRSLQGSLVSGNYFNMLGAECALGRYILPEDAPAPGSRPVVVLSNPAWKSAFAGDPAVLGRKILINGRPFEVIGVMGASFTGLGGSPEDFFVPATMGKELLSGAVFGPGAPPIFAIVGRMAPGVSTTSARAGLTLAVQRATEQLPEQDRAVEAVLTSRATILTPTPKMFAVFSPLIVAFVLVFVICCANAANMMLARAIARQREIGVRLALGASRARLIGQLLSEGSLLAALAGATAYGVAFFSIRGVQRLLISTLPGTFGQLIRLAPLNLDLNVLLFLVLAAALATILSGLAPALQATRLSLTEALRGEFSAAFRPTRLRSGLVVCQISVCLLLLVVTGQLVRSSSTYQHTDLGFDAHGIVFPVFFEQSPAGFNARMMQYLAGQPWVDSTAAALRPPAAGASRSIQITIPGKSLTELAGFNLVSAAYFRLIGIPILRGRNFADYEMESEAAVAIVSQATARRYWPDQDALGRTIEVGRISRGGAADQPPQGPVTVIGIAQDIVSGLLIDGLDTAMIYLPTSANAKRSPMPLVRARSDSIAARNNLEATLRAVQPDRAGMSASIDDFLAAQIYPFLAASWIGGALGVIALALSISGMYGVMNYLVSQRTKEIGIRMALGASPGRVVGLILRQSGGLLAVGIGVGLVLSFIVGLTLTRVFYMIQMFNSAAWIAGVTLVAVAAMSSAFLPARNASRIDPVETLRAE